MISHLIHYSTLISDAQLQKTPSIITVPIWDKTFKSYAFLLYIDSMTSITAMQVNVHGLNLFELYENVHSVI